MVWYENEVQRLEKERAALTYDPKLLFLRQLVHQTLGEPE